MNPLEKIGTCLEVGDIICSNITSNQRTEKIVWDIAVDMSVFVANTWIASGIVMLVSGPLGLTAGLIAGVLVEEFFLSKLGDKLSEEVKAWKK